jgi:hypothetical protein
MAPIEKCRAKRNVEPLHQDKVIPRWLSYLDDPLIKVLVLYTTPLWKKKSKASPYDWCEENTGSACFKLLWSINGPKPKCLPGIRHQRMGPGGQANSMICSVIKLVNACIPHVPCVYSIFIICLCLHISFSVDAL